MKYRSTEERVVALVEVVWGGGGARTKVVSKSIVVVIVDKDGGRMPYPT